MASSTSLIFLVSSVVLVAAAAYFHCQAGQVAAAHLHLYMHDDYAGLCPTAALVVPGRPALTAESPRRFGDIAVMNNALTEGPGRDSGRVGRAQGHTVRVAEHGAVNDLSLHLVLEAGEYAGSSLVVKGRVDTDAGVRESVIVGGTGRFRFARGYAHSRSYEYDLAKGGIVEIDVYVHMLHA